jgi:uncharacterized protein YggE
MYKVIKVVVLAVLGLLATSNVFAENKSVTVTGKATLKVIPDVAYVTLYVRASGLLMADAAKKADQKVEEIKSITQTKFKDIQVIEVSDTSVGEAERESWNPDRKEDIPRPEIIRRIRFTINPDQTKAYELVDVAMRAGALIQVPSSTRYMEDIRSIVIYGLLKSTEIEAKVREAAMEDARQEALKWAKITGNKLGDVLKIECPGSSQNGFPIRVMGRESDYPTALISMNSNEITASNSICVTFEMKY